MTPIAVTLLTGFLGAGKTTLLRHILNEQHGFKIAVIENEFGEVSVDDQLIGDRATQIKTLTNGCICCTRSNELEDALLTAFITPLEREDLDLMSCALDTVLDRIEGVVQRVYFTNIQSIHPDAIVIAHKVTDACRAMKDLMVELPNYRKSKTLRELVIQINTIESEADELYINAMRNLHVNGKDPLEVIAWRDVYAFLEYCADCCENVADVVDSIVMKNS